MCLHPRESAAHHHHIDHEITSSIQAAASFDLSWFLSNKTSLNHLAHYFLLNSLFFATTLISEPLCIQPFSKPPHPIYTLHDQEYIYIYTL